MRSVTKIRHRPLWGNDSVTELESIKVDNSGFETERKDQEWRNCILF
jgi:hypothetical protein